MILHNRTGTIALSILIYTTASICPFGKRTLRISCLSSGNHSHLPHMTLLAVQRLQPRCLTPLTDPIGHAPPQPAAGMPVRTAVASLHPQRFAALLHPGLDLAHRCQNLPAILIRRKLPQPVRRRKLHIHTHAIRIPARHLHQLRRSSRYRLAMNIAVKPMYRPQIMKRLTDQLHRMIRRLYDPGA